jgi:LmbE family N-acetylglucosaminyl deacetylase
VIFTLDNEMGGYGHPDHVMVSQVVRNLAETGRIHPKAIYQGVYSDEIEQEIIEERLGRKLEKMALPNTFHIAKGVYGVEGIPAPEVRVDVSASQEAKTYYLELYGQQGGSDLNRFMHDFEKYNASKFHDLFMWEYFRVLSY